MAVGDTIVGISGTGTEQDPYLVTTIDNVYECVAISGAYVKLVNDIWLKDNLAWRNGTNQSLEFKCAKFYSDNSYSIFGLKILNDVFFEFSDDNSNDCVVENINFLSCVCYKSTEAGVTIRPTFEVYRYNSSKSITYRNCKFSMVQKGNTNSHYKFIDGYYGGSYYTPNMTFEDCSLYCKFATFGSNYVNFNSFGTNDVDFMNSQGFYRCYFYLDSLRINSRSDNKNNFKIYLTPQFHDSTIVYDRLNILVRGSGSYSNSVEVRPCSGSTTNSIVSCNGVYNSTNTYGSVVLWYSGSSFNIIHNGVTSTSSLITNIDSAFVQATEQQLKDEDFLISVGIVP